MCLLASRKGNEMNEQDKKGEAIVLDCYANLPPDEKHIFVEIIEFVATHPGSGRLLREARTKGRDELSEVFAYLLDNWIDPEPLH